MTIKEARTKARLTQQMMSEKFEIPKRTIENWETETRKCPVYVERLLIEKLEGIIMMNAQEVLKKANEINVFGVELPQVAVGDIVNLSDIWNGAGDTPEDSYSYLLTHDGEDGDSNIDVNINYVFEIIEENENPLETVIKITDIELV